MVTEEFNAGAQWGKSLRGKRKTHNSWCKRLSRRKGPSQKKNGRNQAQNTKKKNLAEKKDTRGGKKNWRSKKKEVGGPLQIQSIPETLIKKNKTPYKINSENQKKKLEGKNGIAKKNQHSKGFVLDRQGGWANTISRRKGTTGGCQHDWNRSGPTRPISTAQGNKNTREQKEEKTGSKTGKHFHGVFIGTNAETQHGCVLQTRRGERPRGEEVKKENLPLK